MDWFLKDYKDLYVEKQICDDGILRVSEYLDFTFCVSFS